tara:strand:+ start:92 stop:514 length:423 start_codon:yes stop_codon:yes gene_type:complete
METLRICRETHKGEFVIVTNSVTAPSSASLEKFVYMKCQGGSVTERVGPEKTRVFIKMKYWFRGKLAQKKKNIINVVCKRTLAANLNKIDRFFTSKKESSRVRSILDARTNLSTYSWKQGDDKYTDEEKLIAKVSLISST